MNKEEYDTFVEWVTAARRVIGHDLSNFDLFQVCQPIRKWQEMRHDSIRFGALKPVDLLILEQVKRPWAAVQLRAENTA